MKLAYILFEEATLLDFIGINDPLSRLRSMNVDAAGWVLKQYRKREIKFYPENHFNA